MSLRRGEINALNLLGFRKVKFSPPHFSSINTNVYVDILQIENWIYEYLNDRYCIQKKLKVVNNKNTEMYEISFENEKELLLFSLGCKYLYSKD